MHRTPILAALSLAVMVVAAQPAAAQGFGDRLKKRAEEAAKRKVENRVDQRAGEATDKALDKAEGAVKCAASDQKCIDKAKAEGKSVALTDEKGNIMGGGAAAEEGSDAAPVNAAHKMKPGEGAWANYDFKPGERILYADDFMADEVGDFPRRMEFKAGALEIVEWQGSRFLRATATSKFYVMLPEVLPERFTMEFDYAIPGGEVWIVLNDLEKQDDRKRIELSGYGAAEVNNWETRINASGQYGDNDREKLRKGRILGDGRYIKVYVDDKRILNVPNGDLGRSNRILFYMDASTNNPALFGNFRIAAGGKKLYDALTEKGRVATQGIYFDTGSDRIRPESTPTLKEIGQMLKEHADLKLTIEGHTDNVGNAAANQKLSELRAEAVRQHLVAEYGVEEGRLSAKGLGATKPVAPNTTPEGRQNNRRVELVKA